MKRILFTIAAIAVFVIGSENAYPATLSGLQAQLHASTMQPSTLQSQSTASAAPQSGVAPCPNLTRNLSFGSRGSDVVQLQQFLISQNFLATGNDTGYFGRLTQSATEKWQCKNMNICSGSPRTTGYGAVGPRTRAAIIRVCTQSSATLPMSPISPPSGAITPPIGTVSPNSPLIPSNCTPLAPQSQILECPAGQTGSITQTRTSSCPGPAWGKWQTTSNTCQTTYVPPVYKGASLNDFWSGNAYFQFVRKQIFPIDDVPGSTSGVAANIQQQIVVRGDTWYRFSREYDLPTAGGLRIVIHKSIDKGATWAGRTNLVVPTPGTPWSKMAADGNVFFDASTGTWHYLFQCLGDNNVWNVCYASRQSTDPLGHWVVDPAISVPAGSIFQKIGLPQWHDEGTPQIVEKIGDKFYVTFHGYDGVHGNRIIAWTKDWKSWSVDTNTPIFSRSDCASWNVPWNGGCIGSGAASVFNDGQYYYMVIEATDGNLACQRNQNWVFGILRAINLTTPSWEALPGGAGIIFNTSQLYPDGGGVECGVQYAGLFKDASDTYLSVWRSGVGNGNQDTDPASGWYLYKLTQGAPLASYSFAQGGPQNKYVQSDIVSRGNLEASLDNTIWLNPGVQFNGVNSVMTLPANPALKRSAPWSLELSLKVTAEVTKKSALIAGDRSAAWLELYPGGQLCAWVITPAGPKNACTASFTLNTAHTIQMIVTATTMTLSYDGARTTTAIELPPQLQSISIGSTGSIPEGYYGSWQGTLSKVSFYERAI